MSRRIKFISKAYRGHVHDFTLLQAEFPPEKDWFSTFKVRLDLGFQGFADLYPSAALQIPHKRKRVKKGESNELSEAQKTHNKSVSSERIVVEHSYGGLKRYRILVHVCRLQVTRLIDRLLGVCAALWNFTIA